MTSLARNLFDISEESLEKYIEICGDLPNIFSDLFATFDIMNTQTVYVAALFMTLKAS